MHFIGAEKEPATPEYAYQICALRRHKLHDEYYLKLEDLLPKRVLNKRRIED